MPKKIKYIKGAMVPRGTVCESCGLELTGEKTRVVNKGANVVCDFCFSYKNVGDEFPYAKDNK